MYIDTITEWDGLNQLIISVYVFYEQNYNTWFFGTLLVVDYGRRRHQKQL